MSQSYPKFDRPLAVLHVDDDPMNLRVVEEILVAFNHTAVKTTSGAEALDLLAAQTFDVVLMDIHMPGMSGVEAVEKLRASPGPERSVPVIALTADVFSRRPEDYRVPGFNDFVSKPIVAEAFLGVVARHLAAELAPLRAAPPAEARRAL